MSDKWIEELGLLYESDPRQITPHRASGMGPETYDPRNSWSGKVGISDGTASTRAAATPYQQSFVGEMEEQPISKSKEEESISKSKILNIINNELKNLNQNNRLHEQAIFSLSLILGKIK